MPLHEVDLVDGLQVPGVCVKEAAWLLSGICEVKNDPEAGLVVGK